MVSYIRRGGVAALTAALALAIPLVVTQSTAASGGAGPADACTSSSPCLEWDNLAKGSGLVGTSAKGNGIVGQTKSGSTTSSHAGVQGIDNSSHNFRNYGVLGTSALGDGVAGFAGTAVTHLDGTGVWGSSTLTNGVEGEIEGNAGGSVAGVRGVDLTSNTQAAGVLGISNVGIGVSGFSTSLNGVQGISKSGVAGGVYGENDTPGGFGVAGRNTVDGVAVFADNPASDGLYPALYVNQSHGSLCPCDEVIVNNTTDFTMELDTDGNMFLLGSLTQNGLLRDTTPTSTGRKVVAYAPRDSQPAIEDFGEAQLVDGQASVRLDPTFASTLDPRAPYLVFITPDGATTGGLYVASKSATGFTVRENGSGRSSVVFDYRIVAKPYGSSAPRLPLYTPPHHARIHLPAAWHERG